MCSKFKDFFKLKPELPLLTKSYDICNKCEKSAISPSEFDLVWLPYSSGATVPLYVLSLSRLFCILEIAVDCRIPLGCISCYISVNVSLAFMFFLGDFATLWMVACSSIFFSGFGDLEQCRRWPPELVNHVTLFGLVVMWTCDITTCMNEGMWFNSFDVAHWFNDVNFESFVNGLSFFLLLGKKGLIAG